jgi:glycosyltransferase involved in cell wall biosynthesis
MKICFIAPSGNYHTIKWVNWFLNKGHEVHVISFMPDKIEGSTLHYIDAGVEISDLDSKKIKYLLHGKDVRKIINKMKPEIINVHYATSYGAVAAISGITNYILSIWGSDVYDFPRKSVFHKLLLIFSLNRATYLFSTSNAMAKVGEKYTKKEFEITPFGVDMELFNPNKCNRNKDCSNEFVIGTVKKIDPKYGIDYIIKAVKIINEIRPELPLVVKIAGKGEFETEYRNLARSLGVEDRIKWLGFISQERAAQEWANMDIAVIPSTMESESFGVSAVEAEACGTAVIISDIPGLMEATKPGISCVVVPRKNEKALAKAIIDLYDHPDKRIQMGYEGRKYVVEQFELNRCFEKPLKLFEKYRSK